jgi:two-component system, NarL family, sensor kinase
MPTNKETIVVIAAVIVVLLFIGVMFLLALFYFNNKKRRLLEEKRHREAAYAEELLKTRLEIQEDTFRNISEEIHDNIGQSLSLVKLIVATAEPGNTAQVTGALDRSGQLLTKAIQDLRNLSHSLSPDFLDTIGLPTAIEQQLQQLEKTKQFTTTFTLSGHPEKLNLQKEMVILRVVQELLNNIVKHAKATAIAIDIAYHHTSLTITVKDDGIGFTPTLETTPSTTGIGLSNIRNRIKLIGSECLIQSAPGEGTTVILQIAVSS